MRNFTKLTVKACVCVCERERERERERVCMCVRVFARALYAVNSVIATIYTMFSLKVILIKTTPRDRLVVHWLRTPENELKQCSFDKAYPSMNINKSLESILDPSFIEISIFRICKYFIQNEQ